MLLFLSFVLLVASQTKLIYNVGDQYSFDFYGQVNHGVQQLQQNAPPTDVSSSSISGLMEIQMQQFDGENFVFVMNLFNVDVEAWDGAPPADARAHMAKQLSKRQRARLGLLHDGAASGALNLKAGASSKNSKKKQWKRTVEGEAAAQQDDGGLGPDMFFTMSPLGEILSIWYQEGDDPFFIHVKTSAINSLQTRVVPPNKPNRVILESDVVGLHNSNYVARSGSYGVAITKNFTQTDVLQFADSNVTQATFQLYGESLVAIHPSGYILSSVCRHDFLLVSQSSGAAAFHGPRAQANGSLAYTSNLHSTGGFNLEIDPNSKTHVFRLVSKFAAATKTQTSLLEVSRLASVNLTWNMNVPKFKDMREVTKAIMKNPSKIYFAELRKIAKFFRAHPEKIAHYSRALFVNPPEPMTDDFIVLASRWFYILGAINLPESHTVLIDLMDNYRFRRDVFRVLISSNTFDADGVLLSRVLEFILTQKRYAVTASGVTEEWHEALMAYASIAQRSAASYKMAVSSILQSLKLDFTRLAHTQALRAVNSALAILTPTRASNTHVIRPAPSDFPFNKSYSDSAVIGGDLLSVDFNFSAFLGTNFDCNHANFNYLASAQASATALFLGNATTAFDAYAIYGVDNGVPEANVVSVTVFGKTIYDQPLPTVSQDCSVRTEPITQISWPGFDVSYAVWVSVIPVGFEAALDLDLTVTLAWSVCSTNLSAMIELNPAGRLVASGSAMSYLIVVEGGVNLQAEFDVTPSPQAFVQGSLCTAGFDVSVTYDPMQAQVDVWYRTESCYLWIFDCHWGPYNTDVLWSYNAGASTDLLLNATWKIAV